MRMADVWLDRNITACPSGQIGLWAHLPAYGLSVLEAVSMASFLGEKIVAHTVRSSVYGFGPCALAGAKGAGISWKAANRVVDGSIRSHKPEGAQGGRRGDPHHWHKRHSLFARMDAVPARPMAHADGCGANATHTSNAIVQVCVSFIRGSQ